jgi:hypothetical protein
MKKVSLKNNIIHKFSHKLTKAQNESLHKQFSILFFCFEYENESCLIRK